MRLAILSDMHFGHSYGTDLGEDPFDCAMEGLEKSMDCDLILLGGDIFDARTPTTEVFSKSLGLFNSLPLVKNDVKLVGSIGKDVEKIPGISTLGIPVIAVHGNHERRVKGLTNPMEAMENSGYIIHLHCKTLVFEKDGERVAVHGMSNVPDQYAESVLREWNPKPIEGCYNIFLFHQSISPFVFSPHSIPLESLPRGFDLYVCGHAHEAVRSDYKGSPLLFPGSPIHTQKTRESAQERGFWKVSTTDNSMEFVRFERQRKLYYLDKDYSEPMEKLEDEVEEILKTHHDKMPIIVVKLRGEEKDLPFKAFSSRLEKRAYIFFRKGKGNIKQADKINIEEYKLSVQEMGRRILSENLRKLNLDEKKYMHLAELLMEGNGKEALKFIEETP